MPTASVIASKMRGKQIVFGNFRPLRSFKNHFGTFVLDILRSLKVLSKSFLGPFKTLSGYLSSSWG